MSDYRSTIAECIALMAANFGREADVMLLEAYALGLAELSPAALKQATAVALKSCKFFPSVAELLEFARTGGVSYEAQALVAFEELDRALDNGTPSALSPLTAAVVRQLGGFDALFTMPLTEYHTWKRKEFLAAYATLARENPERIAALAGPQSDISRALAGNLMRAPSRDDVAAIEDRNRDTLRQLVATPPESE